MDVRLRDGEKVIDLKRYEDIYEKLGCKLQDRIRVQEDGQLRGHRDDPPHAQP